MPGRPAHSPGLTASPSLRGQGASGFQGQMQQRTLPLGLQPSRRPLPRCYRVRVSPLCTRYDEEGKNWTRGRKPEFSSQPCRVTLDRLTLGVNVLTCNWVRGGLESLLGPPQPWLFGLSPLVSTQRARCCPHLLNLTPSLTDHHARASTQCQAYAGQRRELTARWGDGPGWGTAHPGEGVLSCGAAHAAHRTLLSTYP